MVALKIGSQNLGYTNADEHLLKAKFAVVINNIIKEKN